jgi:hypothetical protein
MKSACCLFDDNAHRYRVVVLFVAVCYSNGSDTVLDDDVLVILAVSNLHDGRLDVCAQGRDNGTPLRKGYLI